MFSRLPSLFALLSTMLLAIGAISTPAQTLSLAQSSARYAGSGSGGFNVDFGPATTVSLNMPTYVVFDSVGNQYISDTMNNCVRKIDAAGNMSTVAGLAVGGQGDTCNTSSNAAPTATQGLYRPTGLAVDTQNRLYIADSMHHCVRSMANGATGTAALTTVAGTCGPVASASVTPAPGGLAIDGGGNLYVSLADSTSSVPVNQVVRHAAGTDAMNVCLVAGAASASVSNSCGNGNGVTLAHPSGLTFDAAGDLFIADTGNNCVREIAGMKTMGTAAGRCMNDGTGVADMGLRNPFGLAFSPMGTLFITEQNPDNVVSLTLGANAVTIAGGLPSGTAGSYNSNQDGKSALNTPLNGPKGVAFDSFGNFSIADSKNNIMRKLSSNIIFPATPVGSVSAILPITFAVNSNVNLSVGPMSDFSITTSGCAGSLSPAATGASPTTCQVFVRFTPMRPGLRSSPLAILDRTSGTSVVVGLTGTGTGALSLFTPGIVSTVASNLGGATAVALDPRGNAYVLESAVTATSPSITLIPVGGGTRQVVVGTGMGLKTPTAMAVDAAGNVYVADSAQGTVSRFGADGSVNTSYVTGLDTPTAVTVDGFDNLYIAQAGLTHNVVEVYAAGLRRVIAGSGSAAMADSVPAVMAKFVAPGALTIDLNGILYIADTGGHLVYAIDGMGTIHEVAGNGTTATTEAGQATGTALISPVSVAVDAAGDLYIADGGANKVYTVYASSNNGVNIAGTLGTGAMGNTGDGGVPAAASMRGPVSLALDGGSNLFVVDGGNGSVREIRYANPVVDFGTVMVGQTSSVMPQDVTNVGTDNLNLTTPFVTSDSHFVVDPASTSCGTTILTGSVCSLGFTFAPTSQISYTGMATLISNSYNSPQAIQLKGSGKVLTVLTAQSPMNSEMYGQPFSETLIFSNTGNIAPTGTITFTTGSQTLCTTTAVANGNVAVCNALNSNLPVGSYPVSFSYSGDTNYAPVAGTTTLSVSPATLTVTVNNATKVYGAATPALSGTMSGLVSGDTVLLSYASTASASSPAGAYPITATLTAVGGTSLSNYTITNTPGTLTVTKMAVTVTVLNATRQYGLTNPTFASSVGVTVNGDVLSVSYSSTATVTSPVGVYPIAANVSGALAGSYDVSVLPGTLTVTKAPLTVTVSDASRVFGQANPSFASVTTGALNGDSFTHQYSTTATITSATGTYPINDAVGGTTAGNYSITVVPGTLAVTQAVVSFTLPGESEVYGAGFPETVMVNTSGAVLPTGTITFATGGKVLCKANGSSNGISTICTAANSGLGVGSYPVSFSYSGDVNYAPATGTTTLTVTAASLTVTANNATRQYGMANPELTGTMAGLVSGDAVVATYSTSANTASPVGSYAIVPTVSGTGAANYSILTVNGTLSVVQNQRALVIDVNGASRVYGMPNPAFTGNVSGLMNGDSVTVSYSTVATTMSSTGQYMISATISGAGAGNYVATIHPGTLAVMAANTTTTIATSGTPATVGANVTFTATVSSPNAVPAGMVTFTDGNTVLGTATLNASGVATVSSTTLSLGTHSITATYVANSNFNGSAASLNQAMAAPVGSFTIAASPASQVIHGAGSTVYQITLAGVGAFNGPVALSCSGLPADATCSFGNGTPNLSVGGTVTTTMTVTNTAADAKLNKPQTFNPADLAPITAAAVFPVELTGFGVLFAGIRKRKSLGREKMRLLLVICFTIGVLGLSGCGCINTAYRTYTVTVTGTSTTFAAPAQTTSVMLSVGQ